MHSSILSFNTLSVCPSTDISILYLAELGRVICRVILIPLKFITVCKLAYSYNLIRIYFSLNVLYIVSSVYII